MGWRLCLGSGGGSDFRQGGGHSGNIGGSTQPSQGPSGNFMHAVYVERHLIHFGVRPCISGESVEEDVFHGGTSDGKCHACTFGMCVCSIT